MRVLIAAALVAVMFAGCTTETTPEYTLVATGVPEDALAGQEFTFTVRADGAPDQTTDHLGAHYWTSPVADDQATGMIGDAAGCVHTEGDLPGDWSVACTMTTPGTYYVRGHARVTEAHDGEEHVHDFWGAEHMVRVHPTEDQYVLTVTGAPQSATAGEAFEFTLDITGDAFTTDHIGAHHWPADADTAGIADAGACDHQEGDLPGTFTVSCTLDEGDHVVRGHMRITVGEQKHDFWAQAFTVSVS